MSEGCAARLPHHCCRWQGRQLAGGFPQTPATAASVWCLLGGVTHQGLLVFGLSWVLTLSNYSQPLPFSLRAVSTFHEHICTLQTNQSKTRIVKGAIIWQPRPCAPLTCCSFLNHLCFPDSSCIPFNAILYGLLVCVTDAACSLMKQQQPRCKVSPVD